MPDRVWVPELLQPQRNDAGPKALSVGGVGNPAFANLRKHLCSGVFTMSLPTDIRPPFDRESALAKVQAAEDAWNSRDPKRVAQAYTKNSKWRNRDRIFEGRDGIEAFLADKWSKELDYQLMKELWAFTDNRISVRFEYEWRNAQGQWFRTHGNEHWEFDETGLMARRDMSANEINIK